MTATPAAVVGGVEVLKYTAFAHSAEGGNPAGVVLGPGALEDPAMLAIAAEVGYSETAFIWPLDAPNSFRLAQGEDMGRPSLLLVDIDPGTGAIRVSGNAVPLDSAHHL